MSNKTKKTSSKFSKMSKIVIWVMLFAMIGSALLSLVYSLFVNA